MPKESLCIKVKKILGKKAIIIAKKFEIFDKELEVQKNKSFIYVPLVRQPKEKEIKIFKEQVAKFQFSSYIFQERKRQLRTFVELLRDKLPHHLFAILPRSFDVVGNIAIIEIPPELNLYKGVIGEAILKFHKKVRTVLAKAGAVSGTYRIRSFNVIAGEPKSNTIHTEFGCKYYIDLAKAYFSPRLSYEHNRVASLVQEGEIIMDLFTGVGPFAVMAAKNNKKVKVYALDINPNAIELLKKNVQVNGVENRVFPILGDARQVVKNKFSFIADRVIMNLPRKAIEFVDVACEAIKSKGGIVHFYQFVNASNKLDTHLRFKSLVENCGRKVEKILFSKVVRATSPYGWQAVLDVRIC